MTTAFRALFCLLLALCLPCLALAQAPKAGVVLLHGLGGSSMSMATLAYELREKGLLVSSLDMPWSAMRSHDVPVETAEKMVLAELALLRGKGARKLFIAGFSKGGLFAARMAGLTHVDGLIAIAPNGASNYAATLREEALAQARALVAQGKGAERAMLDHYDAVTGRTHPLAAVPDTYLTWFDPEGAMNADRIYGALKPGVPVLLVVPTRDLDNLVRIRHSLFAGLPPHPANKLYEPDANHIGAVNASAAEVARWIGTVLGRPSSR